MQPDEKKKLVEKLVDLTVQFNMSECDISTAVGAELVNRMRLRMRQAQIDARMKHLDPEQVSALLTFYGSTMGRSILERQARIDAELGSGMANLSSEVHHQVIEELQAQVIPLQSDGAPSHKG